MDQPVEDERHARFEPDDPEGRLVELDALFVGVMRRVVGRDRVDGSVGNAFDHRVDVGGFPQRRIHLAIGVVLHGRFQCGIRQREVVRCHLAGHRKPLSLSFADRSQRAACAHVRDVDAAAGQAGQRHVALDHDRFSRPREGP